MASLSEKWLQLGRLTQRLPPYSTVYWHYKQWREAGAIERLMSVLHDKGNKSKSQVDNANHH